MREKKLIVVWSRNQLLLLKLQYLLNILMIKYHNRAIKKTIVYKQWTLLNENNTETIPYFSSSPN